MSRSTYLCVVQLAKLLLGPFFVAFPNLREAIQNNVPIKTQARDCTILPNFIGCVLSLPTLACFNLPDGLRRLRFQVHNGKDYIPVTVTQDMVGHKLGEFSHTKKRFSYKCVRLPSAFLYWCKCSDDGHECKCADCRRTNRPSLPTHPLLALLSTLYSMPCSAICPLFTPCFLQTFSRSTSKSTLATPFG